MLLSSSLLSVALPLLLSAASASARNITGSLAYSPLFPDRSACPASAKVLLDAGQQEAYILADGHFILTDVAPGFHTLSVVCPAFKFMPVLLAVPEDAAALPFVMGHNPSKVPAFALASPPAPGLSQPYPLLLTPAGKEEFLEQAKAFELGGMLKNPMVLMMLLSGVLMFALPKLTSMMDHELLQEANDMLKSGTTPSALLTSASPSNGAAPPGANFAAARKDDVSGSVGSSVQAPAAAGAKRGGKKGRK